MRSGAKDCKSCRSRQGLSKEYLLAEIGFDTAENGPLKVCKKLTNIQPKVTILTRHRGAQSHSDTASCTVGGTAGSTGENDFSQAARQGTLCAAGSKSYAFRAVVTKKDVDFPSFPYKHFVF